MSDSPTILIVDDDPAILLGLKLTIKRHGYQVVTATDGNDGLTKAKEHQPDLILSDVMMPFPDGFEMRRRLRKDAELDSIPFIFLTARTEVQDRIRGLNEGADDYIMKPFNTDELLARIDAVIRRISSERSRVREQMQEQSQKELEQLKQEILQNFHHEISTPLTNILMPLEMSVNKKFDSPEEQTRFLRMALSNANRLESLSVDLILLSNIDQGNLNCIRQPLDLNLHILGPIQKRLERYKTKNLIFTPLLQVDGGISVPRREFSHSVLHLLDNAFKFSPDNGKVILKVEADDARYSISVQDEGPGILPELREKVFERFYQASQGDARQYEGLGVGLTIARAIFEINGGYVKIVDCAKGCCVQAIFPK